MNQIAKFSTRSRNYSTDIKNKLYKGSIKHIKNHGFTNSAIQRACLDLGYSASLSQILSELDLITLYLKDMRKKLCEEVKRAELIGKY